MPNEKRIVRVEEILNTLEESAMDNEFYEYELTIEDHLVFQLYVASKSKRIVRKRLFSIVFVPVCWIIMGVVLRKSFQIDTLLIISVMSFLWLILYPIRSHYLYKSHYLKHINEYYEKKLSRKSRIQVNDEAIICSDDGTELTIKLREVEKVVELKSNFFIFISKGSAIILNKTQANKENTQVNKIIEKICDVTNLSVIDDTNWKWL